MLELLRDRLESGQQQGLLLADQISFGTVLAACSRLHHWALAVELVQLMQTSRLTPDVVPLCSAAAACNRAAASSISGAWRWSLYFFSLARWAGQTPNLTLHNCAISAVSQVSKHGNWALAMQKLQDLSTSRLQPDRVSFSTACAACQRAAAVEQGWRLLRELPRHSLRACALFYSTLVMTCSSQMRWQEAATLLPHLKSGMDTRQAFLGSMVMARLRPEAVQLFDTWRSYPERGPPRRHLERKSDLLPALQVCRATGAVAHALALLRDVTARRWRIDAEALAMAAMARKDSWQRALAFWDESRQVGLDSPSFRCSFRRDRGRSPWLWRMEAARP